MIQFTGERAEELVEAVSVAISDAKGIGLSEVDETRAEFARGVEAGLRSALTLLLGDGSPLETYYRNGFGRASAEADLQHRLRAESRRRHGTPGRGKRIERGV